MLPTNLINDMWSGRHVASPLTITYSFTPSGTDSALSSSMRTLTRSALGAIEAVANVNFVETTSSGALIQYGSGTLGPGTLGLAVTTYYIASLQIVESDITYDFVKMSGYSDASLMRIFMHETLHGMAGLNDVTIVSGKDADFVDNSTATIMSYNIPVSNIVTPQIYDIATLQHIYGANTSTYAGNTTHDVSAMMSGGSHLAMTLWDGSGTDTLDASTITPFGSHITTIHLDSDPSMSSFFRDNTGNTFELWMADGANIENAIGTSGTDYIYGNALNNNLAGGLGHDILDGDAGDDFLSGGFGDDTYFVDSYDDTVVENVGEGADTIMLSAAYLSGRMYLMADHVENLTVTHNNAMHVFGNDQGNVITGNDRNNTINARDGADTLIGGLGNDIYLLYDDTSDTIIEQAGEGTDWVYIRGGSYTLDANVENLSVRDNTDIGGTGNALDNIMQGRDGNNVLNGLGGDDTLDGGVGDDFLSGGFGDDVYFVDSYDDTVVENAGEGADTIMLSAAYLSGRMYLMADHVENLTVAHNNTMHIFGNDQANVITGNDTNNTINARDGADILIGGLGNDLYLMYDDTSDTIIEQAGEGVDWVYIRGGSYTLDVNVENLAVRDNTDIGGTGNALDNIMQGRDGNNVLNGLGGNDTLDGGLGNDTLDGGIGDDFLSGGFGDDIYFVDSYSDTVSESLGEGTDTIMLSADYIAGNMYRMDNHVENLMMTHNETMHVFGNNQDNVITGNDTNNTINARSGVDTLIGGLGNDIYLMYDDTSDTIIEQAGEGTDWAYIRGASYTLAAHVENLAIRDDTDINGTGNNLNNTILGRGGDNILNGEGGADTLTGHQGADTFVFELDDILAMDTVTDFDIAEGDVLDIRDVLSGYNDTTDDLTDYLEISDSGSNSLMRVDIDGDALTYTWQTIVTLQNVTGLTDEDALVTSGNLIVS